MKKCYNSPILLIGILSLLLFISCSKHKKSQEIPQLVKVASVTPFNTMNKISYPGKIVSPGDLNLSFRIPGMIKKVYYSEGAFVRKGAVIAELENNDYLQEYKAVEAKYKAVKQEADRVIELYQTNSTSPNNYDQAVSGLHEAEALYQLRANQLSYTKMIAPFDCYIQHKYFKGDEVVNAGTPIVSVVNNKQLEVNIEIPSRDYIKREQFVHFTCNADVYPDVNLQLEYLDITRQANFNQLFKMRFALAAYPNLELAPGMSVSVTIEYHAKDQQYCSIPVSALFKKGNQSYVWSYNPADSVIRLVPVSIITIKNSGEAIIESSLKNNEQVISAGVNNLKEGEKVRPLPPPPSSNVGGLL